MASHTDLHPRISTSHSLIHSLTHSLTHSHPTFLPRRSSWRNLLRSAEAEVRVGLLKLGYSPEVAEKFARLSPDDPEQASILAYHDQHASNAVGDSDCPECARCRDEKVKEQKEKNKLLEERRNNILRVHMADDHYKWNNNERLSFRGEASEPPFGSNAKMDHHIKYRNKDDKLRLYMLGNKEQSTSSLGFQKIVDQRQKELNRPDEVHKKFGNGW